MRQDTEEMGEETKEYWLDARSDGWESTCEEVEGGAAAEEGKTRNDAEGSEIGRRSEREPNRVAFRIGWGTIRIYGSFDQRWSRRKDADTGGGAEQDALLCVERKSDQGKVE